MVICSMFAARCGWELASGVNLKNSGSTISGSTTAPKIISGTAASQNQNHHFRGLLRITAIQNPHQQNGDRHLNAFALDPIREPRSPSLNRLLILQGQAVRPDRRGQAQDIDRHQRERRKNNHLPKAAVSPFCGPIAIGGSDAKLQHEHEQKKSVGNVEKIKFVPGVRIRDGLRFLARRKRVALHLPVGSRGRRRPVACLREPAAAAHGWMARKANRPREEEKRVRNMLRLDCFGDSRVFPRRSRAGEESRAQRAEYDATTRCARLRRDVFRSAGILPAILSVPQNAARRRQDAGATPQAMPPSSVNSRMRCFQRVVANRAANRDSRMNRGSPALQPVMPGAMENVGDADGSRRSRHLDPCKQRMVVHDGVRQEGFIDAAAAEIERRSIVQRAPRADAREQPIVLAIPKSVNAWRTGGLVACGRPRLFSFGPRARRCRRLRCGEARLDPCFRPVAAAPGPRTRPQARKMHRRSRATSLSAYEDVLSFRFAYRKHRLWARPERL